MKMLMYGLFLIFYPVMAVAAGNTVPLEKNIRHLVESAEQIQMALPEENPEAQKAADDLFRLYQSDAFQEQIRKERQRIAKDLFGVNGKDTPGNQQKSSEPGIPLSGERFYLFVSSSMPLETLRIYAADLAKLSDPRFVMVLRGFVGGARKIGPTASFIANVLKADPGCDLESTQECDMRGIPFIVDPLLFRKIGITQVPAIAYTSKTDTTLPRSDEAPSRSQLEGEPLIVYGDASLGYSLGLMSRETGIQSLGQLATSLTSRSHVSP